MASRYLKSLIWLVSLGGIGYVLMRVTVPSDEKLEKIKASASRNLSDEDRRKLLFTKRLKEPISYAEAKKSFTKSE